MPRIVVPDGLGTIGERVWQLRPAFSEAVIAMSEAVFEKSELPVRLREAVRMRVAQINGCRTCQAYRDERAKRAGVDEDLYLAIRTYATNSYFSHHERLALEYTERFVAAPDSIDDAFFVRLKHEFSDAEILDLTFVVARFLAFGRLTHVLGLDDTCEIPIGSGTDPVPR
jgi:AhpD family alkylhydroperoxidase